MTVCVWRIATDTSAYTADDLTGTGAKASGGRWNAPGTPLLYTSQNAALACLETIVHLKAASLPFNRYLVRFDIPDKVWARADTLAWPSAPVGWDALPYGKVSIDYGTQWSKALTSALLLVPSIIVPEESNILINPLHPDATAITATKLRRWLYDPRLKS